KGGAEKGGAEKGSLGVGSAAGAGPASGTATPQREDEEGAPAKSPGRLAGKRSDQPGKGFLTIQAEPYASATVDGKGWGDTPITHKEIPAGKHTVVLRYLELEHVCNVTVEPGAEAKCTHGFPVEE
ncbi:MAG: PEGA domain-containing protein, partial [Deltaproteobacteria bacterium]|nr:PEGA domain-containing protein [Deltaproteobacteria bacterium]